MKTGYFQHCTFYARFQNNDGAVFSRVRYIPEPVNDPKTFYNWVTTEMDALKKVHGGAVAIMDCKILEAPEHQYYDFSNQ